MTRFNIPSNNPQLTQGLRDRMLARSIAGVVVAALFLAMTLHTAWQQFSMPGKGAIDAGIDPHAAETSTDGNVDATHLDPSEVLFYVHG